MSLLKLSTCLTAKAEHQGPPGDAQALPYHKSIDPWDTKYENRSSKGQAGIQNFTKPWSDVATKSHSTGKNLSRIKTGENRLNN